MERVSYPMSSPRELSVPPEPPGGEHYRGMAGELRKLARQCRFVGARRELLLLAGNYERRADHIDRRSLARQPELRTPQ
jgi:hypothetical protein